MVVNLDKLEGEVNNNLVVTVFLQDADGTTQMQGSVQGRVSFGSTNNEFTMTDDGIGNDETAGDGIYTGTITTNPGAENWASVEVWALDDDLSSNVVKEQLSVHHASGISGVMDLLGSTGVTALTALVLILVLVGGLYVLLSLIHI